MTHQTKLEKTGTRTMEVVVLPVLQQEVTSLPQAVAGVMIGLLLVIAVGGVLTYYRRDPERFRKLLASFFQNEVRVVVSLGLEIWDFLGGDSLEL